MWRDLNTQLFLLINASDHASKLFISFAIFCANYLAFLPIIVLIIGGAINKSYRLLIIKIVITLIVALGITFLIRHLIYSPRPFALDIGTNYLYHDKTSSFPSQHAVFVWGICCTIYFNYQSQLKSLLYLCTIVALLVCWSRIYLGIHWPIDIVTGFLLSLISAYITNKIWSLRANKSR